MIVILGVGCAADEDDAGEGAWVCCELSRADLADCGASSILHGAVGEAETFATASAILFKSTLTLVERVLAAVAVATAAVCEFSRTDMLVRCTISESVG